MADNPATSKQNGIAANYGTRLSIKRKNSVVVIEIQCQDEYAAIELYERTRLGAEKGHLTLELNAQY